MYSINCGVVILTSVSCFCAIWMISTRSSPWWTIPMPSLWACAAQQTQRAAFWRRLAVISPSLFLRHSYNRGCWLYNKRYRTSNLHSQSLEGCVYMQSKDSTSKENDNTVTVSPSKETAHVSPAPPVSSKIVTPSSVQAEEVPTIPLASLQKINALEPEIAVRPVAITRSVRLPTPLVSSPTEYRRNPSEWLQVWWEGIRPAYLPLAIMPVLLGSTMAWIRTIAPQTPFGQFRFLQFILTLCSVVALQMGANLVNDYYDFIHGIDTSNPLGPGALIQQGLIKPRDVLNFGLALLVLGALLGFAVAVTSSPYIFFLGIIGLLFAFFYSAPLGFLAAAVIHVNNMRDVESDLQAGKWTLASIMGLGLSRALYILLTLGAFAIIAALGFPRGAPHLVLINWWALPILAVAITGVLRADMPGSLHLAMQETLKLVSFFALLLVAALMISGLIPVLPHIPTHLLPF